MNAIHPIAANRISIASRCPPKYIPQIAKPIVVTRADPTLMMGHAALETAMCSGKPNIRSAALGPWVKGTVPPMLMEVARRRGGRCLSAKFSNKV
jgi:hypothetical protein